MKQGSCVGEKQTPVNISQSALSWYYYSRRNKQCQTKTERECESHPFTFTRVYNTSTATSACVRVCACAYVNIIFIHLWRKRVETKNDEQFARTSLRRRPHCRCCVALVGRSISNAARTHSSRLLLGSPVLKVDEPVPSQCGRTRTSTCFRFRHVLGASGS